MISRVPRPRLLSPGTWPPRHATTINPRFGVRRRRRPCRNSPIYRLVFETCLVSCMSYRRTAVKPRFHASSRRPENAARTDRLRAQRTGAMQMPSGDLKARFAGCKTTSSGLAIPRAAARAPSVSPTACIGPPGRSPS